MARRATCSGRALPAQGPARSHPRLSGTPAGPRLRPACHTLLEKTGAMALFVPSEGRCPPLAAILAWTAARPHAKRGLCRDVQRVPEARSEMTNRSAITLAALLAAGLPLGACSSARLTGFDGPMRSAQAATP